MTAKYLTGPQVRARYNVSESQFWRWERDERVGFPKPLRMGYRTKLYSLEEIESWERRRAAMAA